MRHPDLATAFGLADQLRHLGLNRATLARLTERGDDLRGPLHPTREALYSDTPEAVAVRLLFCHIPVAKDEAEVLGNSLLERLAALGIIHESSGKITAPLHLRIVDGLFLFSDYLGADAGTDAVMGAGETTGVLYEAAKPEQSTATALDLGCGAGTLALLLARTCEEVVGTDINPRAIQLAQLNAAVNGITNARFIAGSLWEPVAGKRFDLIVSQPPYYPRRGGTAELTFLHGGERGDELALAVAHGLADHLTAQGRAYLFVSWPDDTHSLLPDMQVLRLSANRRELSGSRQSIDVVAHPSTEGPWFLQTEVSPECWGNVRPHHITDFLNSARLLNDRTAMANARFSLGNGLQLSEEGGQQMIIGSQGALLKAQPVSEADGEWLRLIAASESASEALSLGMPDRSLRVYLTNGWLRPL